MTLVRRGYLNQRSLFPASRRPLAWVWRVALLLSALLLTALLLTTCAREDGSPVFYDRLEMTATA